MAEKNRPEQFNNLKKLAEEKWLKNYNKRFWGKEEYNTGMRRDLQKGKIRFDLLLRMTKS
jgi:hypothetical protein